MKKSLIFISFFISAMCDETFNRYFIKNSASDFAAAEQGCNASNAILATIRNANEFALIIKQIESYQRNRSEDSSLDLFFALDASSSLTASDFELSKQFITSVSSNFDLDNPDIRFGVIEYSSFDRNDGLLNQDTIQVEIGLDAATTQSNFNEKVDKLQQYGGSRATRNAIIFSSLKLMQENSNKRYFSKILVLFMGGEPTDTTDIRLSLNSLIRENVKLIVIAFGDTNTDALEERIGLKSLVFRFRSYENLKSLAPKVVQAIRQIAFEEPQFWIGLKRQKTDKNQFTWIDDSQLGYTQWGEEQPSDDEDKSCVVLNHHCCPSRYEWFNVDCERDLRRMTEPMPFVCQRNAGNIFCERMTISHNGKNYTFDRSPIYEKAPSQLCHLTGFPLSAVRCQLKIDPNTNEVSGEFDLSTLTEVPCGTNFNNIEPNSAEGLAQLSVLSSNAENLTENDIEAATLYLERFGKATNGSITETVARDAISTIGNLAKTENLENPETEKVVEVNSRLVETLNTFTSKVQLPVGSTSFNVLTQKLNAQVIKLTGDVGSEGTIDLINIKTSSKVKVNFPTMKSNNQSVEDPLLFATLLDVKPVVLTNSTSLDVISFGAANANDSMDNVTLIYEDARPCNPSQNVKNNSLQSRHEKCPLLKLDETSSSWYVCKECVKSNSSPPTYKVGIGSFALLYSSQTVPSVASLAVASYVGMGISSLFLIATIVIYLRYEKLRTKQSTPALINISFLILIIYIIFAVGVGRVSNNTTCNVFAFLLHFALLSCFACMTLNAFQMYKAFILVDFVGPVNQWSSYLMTYLISFLIVLINFSVTTLYLDDQRKSSNKTEDLFFHSYYRARFMCWLHPPSLYWGFLLPVGLMLLSNSMIFVILIKKIVFSSKEKIRSTMKEKSFKDRILNALLIFVMMGLTWIFGYFLLIPVNRLYQEVFQWLFTIFNVTQGIVVFGLYCLRQENVRQVWMNDRINHKLASKTKGKRLPSISATSAVLASETS